MIKNEVYTKALSALKSGKSPEEMQEAVYGEDTSGSTGTLSDGDEGDGPNGILGLLDEDGEATEMDSTETSDEQTDSSALDILDEAGDKDTPTKEEQDLKNVEFIRADGKRIKVDYTDRERIKRAYAAEVGMRKFQRERDEARKLAEPLQKKAEDYDKLNAIFEESGVDGVVAQLTGGKTLDDIVQERIDLLIMEQEKPAEAAKLKHEQALAKEREARERLERKMESITEQSIAERDAAEQTKLEAMIQPVFNQYSFTGKLGDKDAEHAMDEALWNQAFAKLESYPDDVELTPAMVRREFRSVATTFGKIIRKQADTQAQQATASRSKNAKESLQRAVSEGTAAGSARQEFARKFKSGDKLGALKDVLKGNVKL